MGVLWEEADRPLIALAERLIRANHPHLLDARIGFMYRSEAAQSGNKLILGKARKVRAEQQVFIAFDFVIWIARKEFYASTLEQREALVDHELCHCGGEYGDWKIKKHDVEEFLAIIVRHGLWEQKLEFAAKAFAVAGQGQAALFAQEARGSIASVPKVEIKHFAGEDETHGTVLDLIGRARANPEEMRADLAEAARSLRTELGGRTWEEIPS
jgi:hypothetical protein